MTMMVLMHRQEVAGYRRALNESAGQEHPDWLYLLAVWHRSFFELFLVIVIWWVPALP